MRVSKRPQHTTCRAGFAVRTAVTTRSTGTSPAAELLRVEVSRPTADAVVVLSVTGEIDLCTVDRLRDHLDKQLAAGHRGVVLDLSGVSFFGACGLRLLNRTADRAWSAGVVMRLVTDSRQVLRVLDLTGCEGLVPLADSVAEAVEDCSA